MRDTSTYQSRHDRLQYPERKHGQDQTIPQAASHTSRLEPAEPFQGRESSTRMTTNLAVASGSDRVKPLHVHDFV